METWGLDPNKIVSKETLSRPHRTIVDNRDGQIQGLNRALKKNQRVANTKQYIRVSDMVARGLPLP